MEHLGLNVAKLPILDGIVWQASCSQLSRSEPEPAQGWWREKQQGWRLTGGFSGIWWWFNGISLVI